MFETINKSKYNVFSYGAYEEAIFEANLRESGKTRISTFYSDLSIAEWFGQEAVQETYDDVCKHWLKDVEMFTEFIIALNYKCWEWYDKEIDASQFYADLYHKADELFADHYKDDKEALEYYYRETD